MNYPLRDALIDFLTGRRDADSVVRELSSLEQNYPKPFFYALMNLMGSHDRPRILNVLAGNDGNDIPRDQRAHHQLSAEERMVGALREQLMLRFIFSVPGMPCIYYGDEVGMEGCADPFCRRTYPWGHEDENMLTRYKAMIAMRREHAVLRTGECSFIAPCGDVLGVIRTIQNGRDAFGKKADNALAVTLINRSAPGCGRLPDGGRRRRRKDAEDRFRRDPDRSGGRVQHKAFGASRRHAVCGGMTIFRRSGQNAASFTQVISYT